MITNIKPRTCAWWIGLGFILISSLLWAIHNRVHIATWWWDQTYTMPKIVLRVSQDPQLGVRMADYYFADSGQQDVYDITRARWLYNKSLEIDPTLSWAWYQKARIAFLHRAYTDSLQYLNTFQKYTKKTRPQALYLKGLVLGFAGDTKASLRVLQEYYRYDTTSWYIHNNLAWAHFKLGNFAKMDAISAIGLQKHPTNPWLLMNRGIAQYNLGNVSLAKEYMDKSYVQASSLTPKTWSKTYPGNDPQVNQIGLAEFMRILKTNRKLVNNAL